MNPVYAVPEWLAPPQGWLPGYAPDRAVDGRSIRAAAAQTVSIYRETAIEWMALIALSARGNPM